MQPKILMAEDEEVLRNLLHMYFQRENFLIDQVDNGVDALELAFANEYDLIILDKLMPLMDGLTVLKKLRAQKQTPVVILSVDGGEVEKKQGIEFGANDYILKPFSPAKFVQRVKELIEVNAS